MVTPPKLGQAPSQGMVKLPGFKSGYPGSPTNWSDQQQWLQQNPNVQRQLPPWAQQGGQMPLDQLPTQSPVSRPPAGMPMPGRRPLPPGMAGTPEQWFTPRPQVSPLPQQPTPPRTQPQVGTYPGLQSAPQNIQGIQGLPPQLQQMINSLLYKMLGR